MRKSKELIKLVDDSGLLWAESLLTPAQAKRIIKEYSRYEIFLAVA